MNKFFKKDNIFFGNLVGLLFPLCIYGIIKGINYFFLTDKESLQPIKETTAQVVSIVFNVFVLRYYLLRAKLDKTGRGILAITFVLTAVFFWVNYL
jgi:uncharacterized membrane-anchored protein